MQLCIIVYLSPLLIGHPTLNHWAKPLQSALPRHAAARSLYGPPQAGRPRMEHNAHGGQGEKKLDAAKIENACFFSSHTWRLKKFAMELTSCVNTNSRKPTIRAWLPPPLKSNSPSSCRTLSASSRAAKGRTDGHPERKRKKVASLIYSGKYMDGFIQMFRAISILLLPYVPGIAIDQLDEAC